MILVKDLLHPAHTPCSYHPACVACDRCTLKVKHSDGFNSLNPMPVVHQRGSINGYWSPSPINTESADGEGADGEGADGGGADGGGTVPDVEDTGAVPAPGAPAPGMRAPSSQSGIKLGR